MTDPKGDEILVQFAGKWPTYTLLAFVAGAGIVILAVMIAARMADAIETESDTDAG